MAEFELSSHARTVLSERGIKVEWIHNVLDQPVGVRLDLHDPELVHASAPIKEFGGRTLLVVYNHTTNPWRVVTAFFDRRLSSS